MDANVKFEYGLAANSFELRCKVARIQYLEDKCMLGCKVESGTNQLRALISHLQMEELCRKRSTYTLQK